MSQRDPFYCASAGRSWWIVLCRPGPGDLRLAVVDLQAQVENLERALATRTVIGQALGILMERHEIPADEAFGMLITASSVTNRKLHDVTADLCETGLLPQSVAR